MWASNANKHNAERFLGVSKKLKKKGEGGRGVTCRYKWAKCRGLFSTPQKKGFSCEYFDLEGFLSSQLAKRRAGIVLWRQKERRAVAKASWKEREARRWKVRTCLLLPRPHPAPPKLNTNHCHNLRWESSHLNVMSFMWNVSHRNVSSCEKFHASSPEKCGVLNVFGFVVQRALCSCPAL